MSPAGTRAKAMALPSVGENVPDRISPSPPAVSTFWPWRSTPFSSITRPIIWRGAPAAFCASSAARPMKSRPSSSATVQASAASNGVRGFVHVLAVQIHARFQAQRVARAEAGRLHAGGRAGAFQNATACSCGSTISKPSSPV